MRISKLHSYILVTSVSLLVTNMPAPAETKDLKPQASSQNEQQFGNYVIHYNTLPSQFLSPSISKQYNITRSKNYALLNVVVKQSSEKKPDAHVKANVSATATNLFGQIQDVTMRPVHDGQGLYYIGEFKVDHKDMLKITLKVKPESETKEYQIDFRKEFHTQ